MRWWSPHQRESETQVNKPPKKAKKKQKPAPVVARKKGDKGYPTELAQMLGF